MTDLRGRLATLLAAPPEPPPGKGPEWGKAAPIGLLVILLLCVAFWLLMRSMNKHIRKVRALAEAEAAGASTAQPDRATTEPGDEDDHRVDGTDGTDGTADAADAAESVDLSKRWPRADH